MGKLDSLHIKDNVVKKLAVGETQTSIAEKIGVNQSTVSRFANKDEARILIEEEQLKLAEVTPDAVQNVKDLVKEMPTIPKDDIKRRELSYKASKDVLKATNIFPSPQYAHSIYNYQDQRTQQVFTDDFQEFLDFKAQKNVLNVDNSEKGEEENSQDA